jgi:iron complex transport system ATP-binding protein
MLGIRGFTLSHGERTVLRNLNLDFAPGQVSALFGPNGAGKTTLLRAVFGDHPATAGSLRLGGQQFEASQRRAWQARIGYVPQDNYPGTGLTAMEVVLLGSLERLSLRIRPEVLDAAAASLQSLGILDLAQRRIDQLSGGQRQLVYFAQVLMRQPEVLLLDEPVSALDLRHQILLLRRLRALTRERNLVSVLVLHDLNLAALFADRVVMLHEGIAWADGTPHDVFSSDMLRSVYGLDARVHSEPGGRPFIQVLNAAEDDHGRS